MLIKRIYTIVCWLAVLVLWSSAASVYISPAVWGRYWSLLGLGFPFCVALVIVLGCIGAVCRTRAAFIPVVGLLLCAGSLRDYCPINLSSPPPKQGIKVITYNTLNFGSWKTDERGNYEVINFLMREQPQVACLQETVIKDPKQRENMLATLKRYGYHFAESLPNRAPIAIISRWPIARQEVVFDGGGNCGAAYFLTPSRGDTLIVVNVHMQSMKLTAEERNNYHEIVRNPEEAKAVKGKRRLLGKIAAAGVERAHQADTLATFIDRHRGRPLIVMGDFNDTPISYAHHQVCSRLTDAYRATGNGIGRSFHQDAIYVRIDHMFCSESFKPFATRVMNEVPFSDHYPVETYLMPADRHR